MRQDTEHESENDDYADRERYIRELELINDLPELLLGGDPHTAATTQLDKKIICDFDDFELGGSDSIAERPLRIKKAR